MNSTILVSCETNRVPEAYPWLVTYKGITALLFCCVVLGLPVNFVMLICIPRVKLWPARIRYLLTNKSIAMCLLELNYFVRLVNFDLPVVLEQSFMPIAPSRCAAQMSMYTFSSILGTVTVVGIGVDRWMATRGMGRKEAAEPSAKILILTIIGPWLYSTLQLGVYLLQSFLTIDPSIVLCSCTPFFAANPTALVIVVSLYILFELFLCGLYFVILYKNRTKFSDFSINTATHSLRERFLLSETIHLTEMLFPSVLIHAVCWITALVLCLPSTFLSVPIHVKMTLGLIPEAFMYIHATLHPFTLLWKNCHLRKQVLRLFRKNPQEGSPVTKLLDTQKAGNRVRHFQFRISPEANQVILDRIWAQKK